MDNLKPDSMTRDEYLTAWRARHGVTYSADFVPFSKSRNAKPFRECKLSDMSINWRVTLTRSGRAFSTDYTQGVGHLPGYAGKQFNRETVDYRADVIEGVEKGCIRIAPNRIGMTRVAVPTFEDVAECLALDAAVIDFRTFEDWAADFGYDKDSRAAEKIYNECRRIALDLRAVLGGPAFDELLRMPPE